LASSSPGDRLFGFVQFDFAGTLGLPDGRYLARGEPAPPALRSGEDDEEGPQSVLVIATHGAPPRERRRRKRPRQVDPEAEVEALPLSRVTAIRAFETFGATDEAARWLDSATEAEDTVDVLVDDGLALLNLALHANAVALGDAYLQPRGPDSAVAARIGYGSGTQVADGEWTDAREVDLAGGRRRRRGDQLRPLERVAAVLGGRERVDACETLLLRARMDLDAGRTREAALQLRVGLEALLAELHGALADPGHEEDMGVLEARRHEAGDLANEALRGDLGPEAEAQVRELVETSERVLRRRRVLRG
jgi:hypothetical protein